MFVPINFRPPPGFEDFALLLPFLSSLLPPKSKAPPGGFFGGNSRPSGCFFENILAVFKWGVGGAPKCFVKPLQTSIVVNRQSYSKKNTICICLVAQKWKICCPPEIRGFAGSQWLYFPTGGVSNQTLGGGILFFIFRLWGICFV